jgi:hypothetical protein
MARNRIKPSNQPIIVNNATRKESALFVVVLFLAHVARCETEHSASMQGKSAFDLQHSPSYHAQEQGAMAVPLAHILVARLPGQCNWQNMANGGQDPHSPAGTAGISLDVNHDNYQRSLDANMDHYDVLLVNAALKEAAGDISEAAWHYADIARHNARLAAALVVAGHSAGQAHGAHHQAITLLVLVNSHEAR